LREEVNQGKSERGELLADLGRGMTELVASVASMRDDFVQARQDMAGKMKTEQKAFITGLEHSVSDLKQSVAEMRKEMITELAGAKQAWFGPGHAEPRRAEEKARPRSEARRKKSPEHSSRSN